MQFSCLLQKRRNHSEASTPHSILASRKFQTRSKGKLKVSEGHPFDKACKHVFELSHMFITRKVGNS